MKSTVSTVPLFLVCVALCFVEGHITTLKLFRSRERYSESGLTLLGGGPTATLVVRSERTKLLTRRQLSHTQNVMEDLTQAVF